MNPKVYPKFRPKYLLLLFSFFTIAFTIGEKDLFKVPKGWPKPTYNFRHNKLTTAKIQLGRQLFYDPILSRDSTISCASCHSPYSAFTHIDHDLSHGIDGKIGTRNSPVLFNLAWHTNFMWDGAINHLDVQPLAPINKDNEMDEDIMNVVNKLQQTADYPPLFYHAFGDSSITGQYVLKAMAQFMLTLVSANSKYDKVMRKEEKFSEQEQNGYVLFKKNCSSCHTEPLFTNLQYANNGLQPDTVLRDMGRMRVTENSLDSLKFKVPTLRNIAYSYPYMHDGRFRKLSEVLKHYTEQITYSSTLAPELQTPIQLTANEKSDIIAFLLTLSDKEFVFNSKIGPPALKSK